MATGLIIGGIGVALFVIVYMLFKLKTDTADGNNHFLLQLLLLFLLIGGVVLLGKAVLDSNNDCSWLANNSTVSGAVTTYDYSYYCQESVNTTAHTFYSLTLWFARLVSLYIFFFISYKVLEFLGWVTPK
jgi:hypothetical protein